MSEKRKRRWFRFHLLTAVLMMVGAGIVLLLEFKAERSVTADGSWRTEIEQRGFPFVCWSKTVAVDLKSNVRLVLQPDRQSTCNPDLPDGILDAFKFVLDGATATALLFAVAFTCESLLRRREGRKP